MKLMKKISIVGFGKFGRVLYKLLKDDFAITLYSKNKIKKDASFTSVTSITTSIEEVYQSDAIFYAVPIESFEKVIAAHKKYFQSWHLLIDVLSVKLHPSKIFKKSLKKSGAQAILTHPMFGPDSSSDGFQGLSIMMNQFMADEKNYQFWKNFFIKKKLQVTELSAAKHDQLAANSQALTHLMGRLLEAYEFKPTPIDTATAKKLLEVKELVANDSWELFASLQTYNPYAKKMRDKVGHAYEKLCRQL